jgi:hypothetical protein
MTPRVTICQAALGLCLVGAPSFAAGSDVPRTPSGKPDLSGTYDIANLTPFERDPKYGDQLVLSDEEAKAVEARMAGFVALSNRESDPDREAPPAGGDGSEGAAGKVGGYNYFWIDAGERTLPIDGEYRTSILTDPPNGRLPALTPEGKARRDAINPYVQPNTGDAWWLENGDDPFDGPESLTTVDRCLYVGVATVPARSVPYNNLKTIVQTEDTVAIVVEWMHWTRVIRLDSQHGPADLPSMGGDSIGWWEGDTLVVETTNFLERPGVPRPGLRVIERFTRFDRDTLLYQFTVHDPEHTAPYSGEMPWPRTDDRLFEYACHEGNYAMGNILRGARLLEKETLEKKARAGS